MSEIMTPERAEQARRYRAAGYRLLLARTAVYLLFLTGLISGGSAALWSLLPNPALFVAGLFLLQFLVSMPLRYYGHRVAIQFGISVESTAVWLKDSLKSFLLNLLIQGLLALLILWLWGAAPSTWHLWVAAVAVSFNLFFTYIGPIWIMPLFHKYTPLADSELRDRLLELSGRAGVTVQGVYVEDSSTKSTGLNAALTGVGGTRRIILYDTLIQACTVDEIEVVLAHEMGHHHFNHIAKLTLLYSGFLAAVFLLAGYAVEPLSTALGLGGLTPPALPLMMLLFLGAGLPLLPVAMAVIRQWERDCDAFALRVSGKPGPFITAFQKLADRNLADLSPPRWYYYMLTSHPPIPERIQMARRWA